MKKTAAQSHRILVKVYGEHGPAERDKCGDFDLNGEECPGSRKNMKMQNWRQYLKKIQTKNPQTHSEWIIQQFPNV